MSSKQQALSTRISSFLLKTCISHFPATWHNLFNICLKTKIFQGFWKSVRIRAVNKKKSEDRRSISCCIVLPRASEKTTLNPIVVGVQSPDSTQFRYITPFLTTNSVSCASCWTASSLDSGPGLAALGPLYCAIAVDFLRPITKIALIPL